MGYVALAAGAALLVLPPAELGAAVLGDEWSQADVAARERLAGPATGAARSGRPRLQRRSVRMIHLEVLLLADLPVDVVVVLEQEEGANEAKRTKRALSQR